MKKMQKLTAMLIALTILLSMIPSVALGAVGDRYLVTRRMASTTDDEVIVGDTFYVVGQKVYDMNGKHIFNLPSGEVAECSALDCIITCTEDWEYHIYSVDVTGASGEYYKKYGPYVNVDVPYLYYSYKPEKELIVAHLNSRTTVFLEDKTVRIDSPDAQYVGEGMMLVFEYEEEPEQLSDIDGYIYNLETERQYFVGAGVFVVAFFDPDTDYGIAVSAADDMTMTEFAIDKEGNRVFANDPDYMDSHIGGNCFIKVEIDAEKAEVVTKNGVHLMDLNEEQEAASFVSGDKEYLIVYDYSDMLNTIYEVDAEAGTVGEAMGPYEYGILLQYCYDPFYMIDTEGVQYCFRDGTITELDFVCYDGDTGLNDGEGILICDMYEQNISIRNNCHEILAELDERYVNAYVSGEGILIAEENGKCGVLDAQLNTLLETKYTFDDAEVYEFENGNRLVLTYYYSEYSCKTNVYLSTWQDTPFVDVKQSDWYNSSVKVMFDEEIMVGITDTKFDPNGIVSRYQFVSILYRLNGSPAVSGEMPFDDVAVGEWYSDAVLWAEQNDIVSGYTDGKFHGDDGVTREQVAAFLYRYTEFAGGDVSGRTPLSNFADEEKVSSWAVDEISWAVSAELIYGSGSEENLILNPTGICTRAEAAAIIARYIG